MARTSTSHSWLRRLTRRLSLLACVGSIAAVAPAAAHAGSLRWEPNASQFWSANGSAILAIFQNGQCTQLAADRRPDIVQAIVEGYIAAELAHGQNESVPNFDARYWPAEAQRTGLPTGNKPRVGALIVLQPGVLGAGSSGHIAYVQKVTRKYFRIAEMHAPNLYQVTHQTLSAGTARLAGVSFVY